MRGLLSFQSFYRLSLLLALGLFPHPSLGAVNGKIAIDVSLSPAGSFEAKSEAVKEEGACAKDGNGFVASNIVLPLDTLSTGIGLRDHHMKEKYFETKKYPDAVLKEAKGQNGKFKGLLTVHGTTKPIEGTYTISGDELTANFNCKMSEFNIPKATFMGVGAEDEVTVKASLPVSAGPRT